MDAAHWLVVVLGVAAGSYLFRAAPFVIGARMKFHPYFLEWLVLMALALIAALVAKAFFVSGGKLSFANAPAQLASVGVACALQLKFRQMLLSLAGGLMVAFLLRLVIQ
ncbi:MAG: AzlD domain-containing protein [Nitrospinae bacterium]|nr:AzlD domain-containing protein [Nitrospinota bacterium]